MSEKIVQLNEEVIKGQLKELVRGSVEENLNELLEAEAEKLTQAARYERNDQRQGCGHYSCNLTTSSGNVTLKVPNSRGSPLRPLLLSGTAAGRAAWKKLSLKCTWQMYLSGAWRTLLPTTPRPARRLMGKDVLLEPRKAQRARHAPHMGKCIRLADSVQGEQSRQGVPGDSPPRRKPSQLFLCPGYDLLHQQPQIMIRPSGERIPALEYRRAVPGSHVAVPGQVADGHQCEGWASGGLRRLIDLPALA